MRPGREHGILDDPKWNHAGHDDVDAIAHDVRERAIATRKLTAKGLMDSLAHPASYEDEDLDSIVIDPELVAMGVPGGELAPLAQELMPKLEEWLAGKDLGKKQRALYTLVLWQGPASRLAASGLAGKWYEKEAVIAALRDLPSIPASLVPVLRALLAKTAFDAYAASEPDERHYRDLVGLLAHVDAAERTELLLQALDIDELRPHVATVLATPGADAAVSQAVAGAVRSRFLHAVATIAQSRKAGLPNRSAVVMATSLATLVDRDAEMARAALSIFDLLPGVPTLAHAVTPIALLLARSIDLLQPEEIDRLATFMTVEPPERLPAAAAAWVRLPVARAEAISKKLNAGDRAAADRRQDEIAAAHWAYPARRDEIAALIAPRALAASAASAPPEIAGPLLVDAIRKARNLAELETAVRRAADQHVHGATRALLAQLRETPFRIAPALEPSIAALLEPDDADWVLQEIDGDNPFSDRRAALRRCLELAKTTHWRPRHGH